MVAEPLDTVVPSPTVRGQRFQRAMAAIARRLPFGLSRVVPANLVGYAIINGGTFGVDLGLLTALHGALHWPLPVAITLSYLAAFGISFALNRTLNFASHAPLGRQTALYVMTIAINYLAFILGVGAGLAALGVEYHLARILAAGCEAVFMYSALRWVVFRDK
jgi:putative flippase GtrA